MESAITPPSIPQLEYSYPPSFARVPLSGRSLESAQESAHEELLTYLKSLLASDTQRVTRLKRYAQSDKVISTWQKLSKTDSQRKAKENVTGQAQAITMNVPLVTTHLDDMTSFFAEIYAPVSGAYYTTSKNPELTEKMKPLLDKMNEDAQATAYYTELTLGVRSLLKYNIGGYINEWVVEEADIDSAGQANGMNIVHAADMYNLFWDQSVSDPRRLRLEGEWFAEATTVNRRHLVQRELEGIYAGIKSELDNDKQFGSADHTVEAAYYRYPPTHAGVTSTDAESDEGSYAVDWEGYGASLGADSIPLSNAYEIVTMYVWMNPNDYGLTDPDNTEVPIDNYYLWRFKILNGKRIIMAEPYNQAPEGTTGQATVKNLPIYLSFMHNDDMKHATRSTGELMIPFQRFSSFLLNAHVTGARNSIYGLSIYDPSMVDLAAIDNLDWVAARVPSKQPGRDVRTGLSEVKGTFDSSKTMDQIANVQNLVRDYFPSQALPAQIASMDRAVQSQVSSVMQGATRRLHMFVRILDENVFNPLRFDQYKYIALTGAVLLEGANDKEVRRALGSGLGQLTREMLEQAVRTMLTTMMTNPQIVEEYDLQALFGFWGSLLNAPVDTEAFKLQRNPQPVAAPAGTSTPDGAVSAPGAAAGMLPGV